MESFRKTLFFDLFRSLPFGIEVLDYGSHEVIFDNQYLLDELGYDHKQGLKLQELMHSNGRVINNPGIRVKAGRKCDNDCYCVQLKSADGEWIDFFVHEFEIETGDPDHKKWLTRFYFRNRFPEITGHEYCIFRLMVEHAGNEAYLVNPDGQLVYVNKMVCNNLGYSREEILKGGIRLFDPVYGENYRQHFEELKLKEMPAFETIHITNDGKRIPKEIKSVYLRAGQMEYVCGFGQDISDRKKSEELLSINEEKYRRLVENINQVLFTLDYKGFITLINPVIEKVSGYLPAEVINKHFSLFIHPDDLSLLSESFSRTVAGIYEPAEFRIIHKSGQERTVKSFSNLIDESDVSKGIIGVMVDITQARKTEEALEQTESRYKAFLDVMPDLMFMFSRDGKFIDYHSSNPDILIVPPEGFMNRHISEVLYKELATTSLQYLERLFKTGEIQIYEYETPTPSGLGYFECRLVLCGSDKALALIRNITDKKIAENELIKAKEKAEDANRLKSVFLANISHELRNPFNAIMGYTELLNEKLAGSPYNEWIQNVHEGSRHLLETLDMILLFSKIEAGMISISFSGLEISRLLEEVTDLYAAQIKSKGLELRLVKSSEPVHAVLDERMLRQVIQHLLNNAVKFTVTGNIEVKLSSDNHYFSITISDTGVGIPSDKLQTIFDEFRQVSEGYSRTYHGIGLGLAITHRLISMMNGRIDLESKENKGSVFTIVLPLKQPDDTVNPGEIPGSLNGDILISVPRITKPEDSRPGNKTEMPPEKAVKETIPGKKRILVVEDDLSNLKLIEFYLKDKYDVTTAQTGNEAMRQVKENIFDLALMDINLSDEISGIDVTKVLKSRPEMENVPVIAVTAFAGEADQQDFVETGFSAFISKPFTKNHLTGMIEKWLK